MRILIAHAAWMQGRKDTLSRLLAWLGPSVSRENVTVLESARREPSYVWARRLWAEAARTPDEYAVCLNDDVIICEGFERHVRAAAYAAPTRGWSKLYVDHVMQADTGADLDFLVGSSGYGVARESH